MRHRVYGKHLGRDTDQRKTLFKGLVYSLLQTGTIQTSATKSKAIKPLVDKIITLAKGKRPDLESYISDKNLRERLIHEIMPKLGARTSGFTKVTRIGTRPGDQTMMVKMSLIGAEELKPIKKESSPKESRPLDGKESKVKKSVEPVKKAIVAPKKSVKKVTK